MSYTIGLLVWFSVVLLGCGAAPFTADADGQAGAREDGQAGAVGLPSAAGAGGVLEALPLGGAPGVAGNQPAMGGSTAGALSGVAGSLVVVAGAAGAPPTPPIGCVLVEHGAACMGRGCGYAPDGCGGQWSCGTPVCGLANGVKQSCVEEQGGGSACQVTCHDIGRSCGDYPAYGLHCGGCDERPAGACGVELPGVCSYCADVGPGFPSMCGNATDRLWTGCGAPPASACRQVQKGGELLAGQWCCP